MELYHHPSTSMACSGALWLSLMLQIDKVPEPLKPSTNHVLVSQTSHWTRRWETELREGLLSAKCVTESRPSLLRHFPLKCFHNIRKKCSFFFLCIKCDRQPKCKTVRYVTTAAGTLLAFFSVVTVTGLSIDCRHVLPSSIQRWKAKRHVCVSRTHVGGEVKLHAFSPAVGHRAEWGNARSSCFAAGKQRHCPLDTDGWVPQPVWSLEANKIPARKSKSGLSIL